MMTRVFQRWPRVWMHHQRPSWHRSAKANMALPRAGSKVRSSSQTSATHASKSPVCKTTMKGK